MLFTTDRIEVKADIRIRTPNLCLDASQVAGPDPIDRPSIKISRGFRWMWLVKYSNTH